ncbi:MAG: chemotaxis protein CheW [Myxococcaceae bacterium]|nr:chemotaxis protein CheW [Myxococcaceae bacterium]
MAPLSPTPLQSALASAPDRATQTLSRPEQEFFCFRIGSLKMAFAASHVREVVRFTPLTPLPRTPAFLLGVSGHRGEVLPVVDLLRFLGKGEAKIGPRSRLLIGISGTYVCAFAADQVAGLTRIAVADILPPPLGGDASQEHLDGVVAAANEKDGALHLLNLPKLLQSIRARVVVR